LDQAVNRSLITLEEHNMSIAIKDRVGNLLLTVESDSLVGHDFKGQTLRSADFGGHCLQGADFSDCDLTASSFAHASLVGARFQRARLLAAIFSHADLVSVDFSDSDLTSANFSHADMGVQPRADRYGNILRPPIFSGARISWCASDLTSELVRRAAGDDLDKLHAAGLLLLHRHWTWEQFLALDHPMTPFVIDVFRQHYRDGDTIPECARQRLTGEAETTVAS
jgi:Pentapeptide repeats (9 copies)